MLGLVHLRHEGIQSGKAPAPRTGPRLRPSTLRGYMSDVVPSAKIVISLSSFPIYSHRISLSWERSVDNQLNHGQTADMERKKWQHDRHVQSHKYNQFHLSGKESAPNQVSLGRIYASAAFAANRPWKSFYLPTRQGFRLNWAKCWTRRQSEWRRRPFCRKCGIALRVRECGVPLIAHKCGIPKDNHTAASS